MSYGTPTDPVAGTVITVAFARTNILDPIRWLRIMTGGGDPSGSNLVVVSLSPTTTSWMKVPATALATNAARDNLGYTPMPVGGGDFSGVISVPSYLTVRKIDDAGNGGRIFLAGSAGLLAPILENTSNFFRVYNSADVTKMLSFNLQTGELIVLGAITASSASIDNDIAAASVTADDINATTGDFTTVTATGTVTGNQLAASVSNGSTPPLSIHANQQNVEVPNLKAAKATLADNSLLVGGLSTAAFGIVNSVNVVDSSGVLSGLTTSMQDIPGLSISAPSTGTYLVIGSAIGFAQAGGGFIYIQISVNGSPAGPVTRISQPLFLPSSEETHFSGGVVMYAGSITAGHAVKLRAKSQVTDTSDIQEGQLALIRIA